MRSVLIADAVPKAQCMLISEKAAVDGARVTWSGVVVALELIVLAAIWWLLALFSGQRLGFYDDTIRIHMRGASHFVLIHAS